MITISLSKVRLIRESNHRYDVASKKICGPKDAADVINAVLDLEHEAQEVVAEIVLDNKNNVMGVLEVTRGSINSSIVHCREIFRGAILHNGASIILAHCHPSGEIRPSKEDITVTEQVIKAGKVLDIPLLDHIIIGRGRYASLKQDGYVIFR